VDQPHPRPHVQMKKAHELKSPQVRRNDPAFPARGKINIRMDL
jgi:hypothetical protein